MLKLEWDYFARERESEIRYENPALIQQSGTHLIDVRCSMSSVRNSGAQPFSGMSLLEFAEKCSEIFEDKMHYALPM